MTAHCSYLALDLGAESGRGLLGHFTGNELVLEEIHRFPNKPVQLLNTLHWNLLTLLEEIKIAIQKAAARGIVLDGIGIDTWGVDFGLVGASDTLLGNPVHYRDARTDNMLSLAFSHISREEIYNITGLQFLPFNTIYQLLALRQTCSPLLDAAQSLLMMPDLFTWLLTGMRTAEYTNATTTQLLDAKRGTWSSSICNALNLPHAILPPLIKPGTEIGPLRKSVTEETGISSSVTVIAPATHDTASAVAAVPVLHYTTSNNPPDWCYLSSGTWSLLGVEITSPVITSETLHYNFTNEGGVEGTIRLLKNIMGLWLVQECRRTWARMGLEMTYEELMAHAQAAPPFTALVDPDHVSFLPPGDMPGRLTSYCKTTGQIPPGTEGSLIRCCLESLALKYEWTISRLEAILNTRINRIYIVGGGAKNTLLCQFTANACNRPVYAGPIEATAIGNILMQALGRKELTSIAELRSVVARSFPPVIYEPKYTSDWADAARRFRSLVI